MTICLPRWPHGRGLVPLVIAVLVAVGGLRPPALAAATPRVWTWGLTGEAGSNLADPCAVMDGEPSPCTLVPALVAGPTGAKAVASGLAHGLVLTGDGSVWAWGDNSSGQLGVGLGRCGQDGAPCEAPQRVRGL